MTTSYGVFRKTHHTAGVKVEVLVEVEIIEETHYRCFECESTTEQYEIGAVFYCDNCSKYSTYRLDDMPNTDAECYHCDGPAERSDGVYEYVHEKYCYDCDQGPVKEMSVFVCQSNHGCCDEGFDTLGEAIDHLNEEHLGRDTWKE